MLKLPKINSLANQTAELMRESITSGEWLRQLPSERILCKKFLVSRNTLRHALRKLHAEKLILTKPGSGTRILKKNHRPAPPPIDVGLLSPEPLERLRPTQTLWIDELRALLSERGCRMHLFHGQQYFGRNPGTELRRLVAENPLGCWILTLSNAAIQKWFAANNVRCVVAGSVHAGLKLPSCDLDHRATCRHAAGVFLGLGHRKLALLLAQSQLAGAFESEAGFIEGVKRSPQGEAEALVCYHDGTNAGVSASLRQLMNLDAPPTAMLVASSYHYLTAAGCLDQMGRRVPQDISLISRDDDLFLSYVIPTPARYRVGAHMLAKSLLKPILALLENRTPRLLAHRLMPEFVPGESLSRIATSRHRACALAHGLSA